MMRKFRLFGLLLLVLALFPFRSYAVDFWPNGSYWNGITSPGYYAALVRADDIYGAAVYGLNKDPASLSGDVRVKLSDPNYGGKFYEYAQTFYNVEGWPNMPEWVPTYVLGTTFGLGQSFERVYASEVTTTLRDEALRDFERVLAGEDLGGGSGGGSTSGDYYTMSLSSADVVSTADQNTIRNAYNIAGNATFDNGSVVAGSGTTNFSFWLANPYYVSSVTLYISPAVQQFISDAGAAGKHVVISVWPTGYGVRTMKIRVAVCDSYEVRRVQVDRENLCFYYLTNGVFYSTTVSSFYHDSNGIFAVLDSVPSAGTSTGTLGNGYYGYVGDVYVPPSGDWPEPETPATPTPPDIPTPTAPTGTPDPTPTEPTVIWPTAPIVVNPPEVTVEVTPSGLDYTELLTRINDNLNELNSYVQAINGSLNSLRSDIIGGFDDVVTSLRNIYQYLQHLNDILELHCKHLRDALDDGIYNLELYLKSLFEWLPQQLDFDANFDYDDSGIKSYLQRILNKIPGGATGTPQTYMPNPQADEPGFFDWLLDLWHRFLIDLVSVLPDELGGLVDAFSQLTHYFPFSIPWDLAALLALFEHEPVTPVFDVPWGFGGDEGEIEMVRVDLSAWDGVMEMVRPVFLVGFCWQLAMITKDLLANFDINKGGV